MHVCGADVESTGVGCSVLEFVKPLPKYREPGPAIFFKGCLVVGLVVGQPGRNVKLCLGVI